MKEDIKDRLVSALDSATYPWAQGRLYDPDNDGRCGLGVAYELAAQDGAIPQDWKSVYLRAHSPSKWIDHAADVQDMTFRYRVEQWAGLTAQEASKITWFNDYRAESAHDVAMWIKEVL